MGYSTYILRSITYTKYYIGSSENPMHRLKFHNSIEKGFTSRYRPWELVWTKEFPSKEEALRVERLLKSWKSKVMLERLINGLTIL